MDVHMRSTSSIAHVHMYKEYICICTVGAATGTIRSQFTHSHRHSPTHTNTQTQTHTYTPHEIRTGLSDPFVEVLVDYEKKWKAETFPETSVQDQTINPGVQGAKVEYTHFFKFLFFGSWTFLLSLDYNRNKNCYFYLYSIKMWANYQNSAGNEFAQVCDF